MRLIAIVAVAILPWAVHAAPTWQVISSEPGKRIEIDRTSIKREDGGKVTALGRVILEKELTDARTGSGYRVIEALTRYDCTGRNAATVKRAYKKNENELLREEEINGGNLPVRSGTLDDKVLREVCRPADNKASAVDMAKKANAATDQLKAANEALIQQEVAKAAGKVTTIRTSDTAGQATASLAAPAVKVETKPAPVAHTTPSAHVLAGKHAAPAKTKKSAPTPAAHAAPMESAHLHWAYEGAGGPENWHKLDPRNTVCATGERQSPIDIQDGIKVDLEAIKFDYPPSQFGIVDNGHTIQVSLGGGSITVTGKTYQLLQFHFHKPSEEKVNGKRFDMVAHLVHKADNGQLAVVAVLLERGAENPTIQTLWNNLPLEKNLTVAPPAAAVNLNAFLPASRDYYTYMGSLTTPPCSEGVLWLVMKQAVGISEEQLNIFSRLYRNNARPIQASSSRLIKEAR